MEIAFEDLCSRFDLYLNRIYHETTVSHKGIIVFDKSAYEGSLQKLSMEFRQTGTRWRNIRNIREVPFFVDSRASRLIQFADHVAYAVFRRYNAGDLTYFNCIENRFDNHHGVIHGLVHKQTNNPTCTCPACITRKSSLPMKIDPAERCSWIKRLRPRSTWPGSTMNSWQRWLASPHHLYSAVLSDFKSWSLAFQMLIFPGWISYWQLSRQGESPFPARPATRFHWPGSLMAPCCLFRPWTHNEHHQKDSGAWWWRWITRIIPQTSWF